MNSYLTEEEKSILFGTLLGNGHLNKRGNSYRLKIEHSIEQKNYAFWKRKNLQRLCLTTQEPKVRVFKDDKKSIFFYTQSIPFFDDFYYLFYKFDQNSQKWRKHLSSDLIQEIPMNPLVLAVWFLDDGSVRNDSYSGKIATQCFDIIQINILKAYLLKWDIDCNIVLHKKSKNQYYISIPSKSFIKLVKYIEEIVNHIPDMTYKLNEKLKPRNDLKLN